MNEIPIPMVPVTRGVRKLHPEAAGHLDDFQRSLRVLCGDLDYEFHVDHDAAWDTVYCGLSDDEDCTGSPF